MAHAEGLEPPKAMNPDSFQDCFLIQPDYVHIWRTGGGSNSRTVFDAAYRLSRSASSPSWVPVHFLFNWFIIRRKSKSKSIWHCLSTAWAIFRCFHLNKLLMTIRASNYPSFLYILYYKKRKKSRQEKQTILGRDVKEALTKMILLFLIHLNIWEKVVSSHSVHNPLALLDFSPPAIFTPSISPLMPVIWFPLSGSFNTKQKGAKTMNFQVGAGVGVEPTGIGLWGRLEYRFSLPYYWAF